MTRGAQMRTLRIVPTVGLVISAAACTEWHTESVSPRQLIATQPSQVRVTLAAGDRLVIPQPSLVADTLVESAADPSIRVPLSQVEGIATRQMSGWKTGLLVGGIAAATVV